MPARRVDSIVPFLAMDVLAHARELEREGIDVVRFEIGEPDFPTPAPIKQAVLEALEGNATNYTAARGENDLVSAIRETYAKRYGVTLDPRRILVSAGTSPVLLMAVLASVDVGDEVIVPRPFYPCYPNFIRIAGGTPVFVDARVEDGFRLRPDDVRKAITPRTKAILLNSPGNPTGAVLPKETLREIADLGILIISDEIYHGLTYEGEEHTVLEFTENAFVTNGFSKSYAMTGWRLGYVIVPEEYIRAIEILQQNIIISANHFVQRAGVAALTSPSVQADVERMRAAYNERRRLMVEGVRSLGLGVPVAPTGAFYVLADARAYGADSIALSRRILEETHVAVTPGEDFGVPGFLRFSYTTSKERIEAGIDRLRSIFK